MTDTHRALLLATALALGSVAHATQPTDPYLELGVSAVEAGGDLTLAVRGASPGSSVRFLRGTGYGSGMCPAALSPDCLQITGAIHTVGTVVADGDGYAELVVGLGAIPQGLDVVFQAVSASPDVRLSEAQWRITQAAGSNAPYGVGLTFPADDATIYPNQLYADTITLTEPVEVTGFDCLGRTLGGSYRAALYDDLGDHPDELVAESPSTPVNVGSNPSVNLSAPTLLPAGRYWLAVVFDSIVDTYENGASPNSSEYFTVHTYNQPFPDPLVAGSAVAGPRIACSVTVQ